MSNFIMKDSYRFMVTGTSISKGVIFDNEKGKYLILKDNYVTLVQDKLKVKIINVAKFGNTITRGIPRIEDALDREMPDVAVIEYGGNDCDFAWNEIANDPGGAHLPLTEFNLFEESLRDTIKQFKDRGIIPILLTLPPLNAEAYLKWVSRNEPQAAENILKWLGSVTKIYWWHERYNSLIVKVAMATRTQIIDIRGAFLEHPDFQKFLCSDGIHPNREGHKVIAEKIIEYIQDIDNSELFLLEEK